MQYFSGETQPDFHTAGQSNKCSFTGDQGGNLKRHNPNIMHHQPTIRKSPETTASLPHIPEKDHSGPTFDSWYQVMKKIHLAQTSTFFESGDDMKKSRTISVVVLCTPEKAEYTRKIASAFSNTLEEYQIIMKNSMGMWNVMHPELKCKWTGVVQINPDDDYWRSKAPNEVSAIQLSLFMTIQLEKM